MNNLIEIIKKGGRRSDRAIEALYVRLWNKVKKRSACDLPEDFEDCYQNSVINFIEIIQRGKEILNAEGYLFKATNYCCFYKKQRKQKDKKREDTWMKQYADEFPDYRLSAAEQRVMKKFESLIGERCVQLIFLSKSDWTMNEIAEELGYKNAAAAKTAKYKCIHKAIDKLEKNPELKHKIDEIWSSMH